MNDTDNSFNFKDNICVEKIQPELTFSTKSIVFGIQQDSNWESDNLELDLKKRVIILNSHKCGYCNFKSNINQIHNLSDNHEDNREENLIPVDPICHAWKHLGELQPDDAVITYLQSVSPKNFNHLQRTLLIAINSSDEALKEDAQKILNWLGKRKEFVIDAFKTASPNDFAKSIAKLKDQSDKRSIVFKDLFLLLNPKKFKDYAMALIPELKNPITSWKKIYKDIDKTIG